jgi:hypothetical protein
VLVHVKTTMESFVPDDAYNHNLEGLVPESFVPDDHDNLEWLVPDFPKAWDVGFSPDADLGVGLPEALRGRAFYTVPAHESDDDADFADWDALALAALKSGTPAFASSRPAALQMERPFMAIGEGEAGCVVYPRLPCEDEEETAIAMGHGLDAGPGFVSKVYHDPADAEAEASGTRRLMSKLGPAYSTHGVPIGRLCKLKDTPAVRAAVAPCRLRAGDRRGSDLQQVIMPFGGIPLTRVLGSNSGVAAPTLPLLKALVDLASWMSHVHSADEVHFDIKPDNVLVDKDHACLRLIDFNFLINPDDVMDAGYCSYFAYPFDWALIRHMRSFIFVEHRQKFLELERMTSKQAAKVVEELAQAAPSYPPFVRALADFKACLGASWVPGHLRNLLPPSQVLPFSDEQARDAARILARRFATMAREKGVGPLALNAGPDQEWYKAHRLNLQRRTDVYGFGLLLLAIAGNLPVSELMTVLSAAQVAALQRLVLQTIGIDYTQRPSMAQFIDALRALLSPGAGGGAAGPGGPGGGAAGPGGPDGPGSLFKGPRGRGGAASSRKRGRE